VPAPPDALNAYWDAVAAQLRHTRDRQWNAIRTAGAWVAEALLHDHWFYTFGTGHSRLLAEEVFHRAGGLARAVPILAREVTFEHGAVAATDWERTEGGAGRLLEQYPLETGDVLLVISNSGRNAAPIEAAQFGKQRGLRVIALLSAAHCAAFASRHSSGQKLTDVADLVLDNAAPPGDASVRLQELPGAIGPTSTITGALIVNAIIVHAIELAAAKGCPPEIYSSSNAAGDSHNETIVQRYRRRIRHL
jgi:uncharacterized phosphosugar-binding protein